MQTPLVTVYITNFNYEKYIRQSIDSVLTQSLREFELLIIDDGSTDNSKEIIEEYRSHPAITIIYQQNKGLNVTNNIAMRASKAKYIMRLDADDYLSPDALAVMTNVLEKNETLGLVFPNYYYVDASGKITGEERRHDFEKEVSLYDQPAHGACTMIRLEYLRDLGGYNESFTCQDGYDLWIKFIMHHKVTNISEPLFYYRRHGANLTTNEERILSTRKKIKDTYVETFQLATPTTVAVIPVRNTMIGKVNWPLHELELKSILETVLEKAVTSEKINWVVVTSSDKNILEFLTEKKNNWPKLQVIPRPIAFEAVNESLFKTFEHVLSQLALQGIVPQAILSASLEYPFITTDVFDDAVNTLAIFRSDSLLSVRPDNRMYYQHVGHGMVPILDQDKFTKLEREALYKSAGGVVISTVENLMKNKKMVAGKVGHIVVDQRTAFMVQTPLDIVMADAIAKMGEAEKMIAVLQK
jgi:glycosyltransferase involved in cell wall biosynthesis